MSISILGGTARGFNLAVPNSKGVRPTSVLLKRKFFDSHQDLEDQEFYDICAGSGSVGFEALSRGAKATVFVEQSSQAIKTIRQNDFKIRTKHDLPGKTEVIKSDALKWLKNFEAQSDCGRIIFFDPPYEDVNLYKSFLNIVQEKVEQDGLRAKIVLEFCRQKTASEEEVAKWFGKPDKFYRQGTSFLYIYDLP